MLCGVPHERDLLAAADRLERAGIRFALFREPDRNDEVTALATEPLCSARRGIALSRYRCLTRSDLLSAPVARVGVTSRRGPRRRVLWRTVS